ncbi:MAG: sialidase family protein [bacterium]|nr:sialidase family protein [bacterium]
MKTNVYSSGEDGYHTYRIPALLVSPEGALLAFCEGRRNGRDDHGDIDLLVKRSEDGGKTWSAQTVVYGEPGEVTIGNPCPVVDGNTGTIWVLFCRDNTDVLVTHSADGGRTWAVPVEITQDVKSEGWTWYATGPGIGIQLARGEHKGRLVVPSDHRKPEAYNWGSHMVYSDDGGKTWRVGGEVQHGANECQVVELADGSLLMNTRVQGQSRGYRGVAVSRDGGESWEAFREDKNLPCPICQASLVRVPSDQEDRLLFSNPVSGDPPGPERGRRVNLTVRLSEDGGKMWSILRKLNEGPAAYSCLTLLSDGSAACLYEAGVELAYEHLVFERFEIG